MPNSLFKLELKDAHSLLMNATQSSKSGAIRQQKEPSMQRLSITQLALIAVLLPTAALSQEEKTYDRVDLSISAERAVENDLLIAIVYAEVEANRQSDAANGVNEAIRWAADRAREVDEVELQTMLYSTRPVYANERRIVGWIAQQSLRLESKNQQALSALLGDLQTRVAIQSINYGLSKTARDAAEDELIAEGLAQFNRRAALVARELGRSGVRIVHLNVGTSGGSPIAIRGMRTLGATADVAAPEIEAGVQTLFVSINGMIELEAER
jgi:predicted secreted protein